MNALPRSNAFGLQKRGAKKIEGLEEAVKTKPITADIALFGRMVTSDYFADVDAAMQVAHAISTHVVNRESDFFTAVDDLMEQEDDPGAGMMGDTDYNSCCYYQYAALDIDQLKTNLGNTEERDILIRELIPALLRAMVYTNPSGKQNTFAGQVLPDLVMVECKEEKIPLSYANAYEDPVRTYDMNSSIVQGSIKKLFVTVDQMDKIYALPVKHRLYLVPRYQEMAPGIGTRCESFPALVEQLVSLCV